MNLAKEQNKTDCLFLQETLETLEDVLTEGIFRSTPDRGILFANSAIINMFGYQSLEELKSVSNNLLYADEEARKYLIDKLAAEGSLQTHRVLYRRKDHSNFWGSLTCKQVVRNGGVCYEGVVTDITETIRQEKQIQEKQDALEKLTMEMDRFIYSASHDIRSPISSIQGLINIMKLELKDANSKNLVELMAVSVNRLERFVNGLTAFARNAKKEIKDIRVDFNRALTVTLEKFKQQPSFSKVTVTHEISQANIFYSDLFRVRLILDNVIKNAFDYCDLYKSTPIISIQITTLPEKAVIEVFDTGIGIAAPHLDKVFNMFYRGTDASKGSGMGLYTTREAVIKLGGIITISSEYGIGTSVRIELPNSKKGKLINKRNLLKANNT